MSILARAASGLKAFPLGPSSMATTTGESTGRGAINLVRQRIVSYSTIYRQQPWVYVGVNKLARSVARLPLKSYTLDANGDRQRERSSSLARLMLEPAPRVSPFRWKEHLIASLYIYGNAIFVKSRPRPGAAPNEVWPTPTARWNVIPGVTQPIGMYVYTTIDGERLPFLPEQVLHARWFNPDSELVGLSAMEPLRRTLAMEDGMQRAQVAEFENGMRTPGVLSTEHTFDTTKPGDDQALRRLSEDLDHFQGGPERAGRPLLLEGGLKWESQSTSMADSELVPLRKLTREEVAAALDLPPPVIGILDHATFANITQQRQMLYQDTLGSPISLLEDELRVQFVGEEREWSGLFLEFDLDGVLRGNTLEELRGYQLAQWFMTPNEVRRIRNLPRLDDPEAGRIHVPLATTTEVSDPANQQQQALMSHLDHLEQQMLSRVGAGNDLPNLERWAMRTVEIGGAPEEWGPLLSELAQAGTSDDARGLLNLMRGAILPA